MAAYQENQIAGLLFRFCHQLNEFGGIQRTPGRIEKDLSRAGMFRKQIEAPRNNLPHFAARVPAASFDELVGHGICVRIPGFADVIKGDLQSTVSAAAAVIRLVFLMRGIQPIPAWIANIGVVLRQGLPVGAADSVQVV